jgi:NADH dehydrogenase/NADH:ubiquinone oxidoreductase subunit G
MTFPKRTFEKPIPISPTIALDRERCILCYRCTRFSEAVAEDGQLSPATAGELDHRHVRGRARTARRSPAT